MHMHSTYSSVSKGSCVLSPVTMHTVEKKTGQTIKGFVVMTRDLMEWNV